MITPISRYKSLCFSMWTSFWACSYSKKKDATAAVKVIIANHAKIAFPGFLLFLGSINGMNFSYFHPLNTYTHMLLYKLFFLFQKQLNVNF